jgi:hypothetical protein
VGDFLRPKAQEENSRPADLGKDPKGRARLSQEFMGAGVRHLTDGQGAHCEPDSLGVILKFE